MIEQHQIALVHFWQTLDQTQRGIAAKVVVVHEERTQSTATRC